MLKLKDKNKKLIAGLINYKDLCIESVLATGDKTLSFSLPKEDKFYNLIEEECYIETKTQEYVIKARDVGVNYTRFDCVLNLEELEANVFDRFESVEQTITASLNLAIVGTGWTVKDNTLKKKRTVRCTNKNALEIVQEIKKTYRVDIVFNTLEKQIEIYEHLGKDKGTYFIDSLNLTALQVQSDSYQYATRIIAEGKDGLSFADINNGKNYVENYQYSRKVKTIYWKDERYTIKENLLEDARAKLEEISKPFRSYSASILNLAELNPRYSSILDFKLGDAINLISKKNKIKDKQRIVKTIEWPQDHTKDSVELANATLKFEDIQQENQETTDTVNNITTDNGTVDGSTIDSITTKQIEDFEANVIKVAKLKAILAEIENLHVNKADIQNLNAVIARIGTLEATKASITELNAIHAIIQQIKAGKADITDLNAAVAKVGILENKTAVLENALAGNLTADNFKTNAITAGSAVIAEGAIGSSQISSLSVNKLEAGDITTSKHRIVSADGTVEIVGNQILINRNNINRVILGEYRKLDNTTEYGLLIRGKDGRTVMFDSDGVHNAGITDGAIDNNKVADNANISGNKLDINSVIREVNANGTETIKGTKVIVGDRTLDVELSTQKNTITEHGKELSSQKATIQALDSAIKLKVDSQTFTQSTTTINNNINKAKEEAINTANSNTTNAINSLEIGGRNLVLDSLVNESSSNYEFAVREVKGLEPNTEYIFSANGFIKSNNEKKSLVVYIYPPDWSWSYNFNLPYDNAETRFIKFRTPNEIKKGIVVRACCAPNSQAVDKNLATLNWYKVEKGNKLPTDWTPAPEDLKAYSDDVAKAKADLAQANAIANADGKITEEERKRIAEARKNLDTAIAKATEAETKAKSYADSKKQEAIKAAENLALEKSNLAKKYAEDVATAKANLAKTEAIANADGKISAEEKKRIQQAQENLNTAISKADKAKQDAILEANRVAELKKQEAISSANSHADSKDNEVLNNAKAFVNAEITTVNTHLNKATAEINVLKEKIESKVSQSDIDKSIQEIKIGGINLLKNSDYSKYSKYENIGWDESLNGSLRPYLWSDYNSGVSNPSEGYHAHLNITKFSYPVMEFNCVSTSRWLGSSQYFSPGIIKPNCEYTFSIYLYGDSDTSECQAGLYYFKNGSDRQNFYSGLNKFDIKKGEWNRYEFTFKTSDDLDVSKSSSFYIYGYYKIGKFYCTKSKLEEGNFATGYSKAPEDMDQLIIDNIKTVTDKISTVESKFTQENNSIKASVQDLNSTTQSITTNVSNINIDLTSKINSNLDVAKSFATDIAIAKANLAKEQAIANADGKITEEERKRIAEAKKNLDTAIARADKAKQDAINTASSDATNKANNALNSAKAYTNAEITTINSKVHNVESNLNILSDRINSKVSQSDVEKSIREVVFNGRNLVRNSDLRNDLSFFNINNNSGHGSIEIVNFQGRKCLKFTNISEYRVSKYLSFIAKGFKINNNVSIGVDVYAIDGEGLCFDTSHNLGVEYINIDFTEKNKWIRLNKTSSKKTTKDGDINFALYGKGKTPVNCYITLFKVEEGNKSTGWTPAPEDESKVILDNIKVVDSKISDVSSSVTQLRDSVTTQINSINSKTHSIETTLNGKASKQEVTAVDSKITTIKADLSSITQRVSSAEVKTNKLNDNIQSLSSRMASAEQKITPTAIINTVSSTIDSKVNSLKNDVNSKIVASGKALENLRNDMNGAFRDGVLTEAEKKDLEKQLNDLEVERNNVLGEVDSLMQNEALKNTNQLIALNNAKKEFIDNHFNLINAIRKAVNLAQLAKPSVPNVSIFKDVKLHYPHFSDKYYPAYPDISVIENHNGEVYLFDAGEKVNQYDVEKYLKSKNIYKIDKVFVTHSHSDHIEGLPYLLDKFGCKELYIKTPNWSRMPAIELGEWKTKQYHEAVINKANSIGAKIIELNSDRTINLTDRTTLRVVNAGNNDYSNYNNISLGFLFEFRAVNNTKRRYFIQADMSYQSENFVGGQNIGKVDILKLGHHGNTNSSSEIWLNYLKPSYSVATLGYPLGTQVKLNAMRCKFVSSKVFLPNDNPNHMSITIDKDSGAITTSAIEHKITNTWYQRDNGDWYYFDSNGGWAHDTSLIINNRRYRFNSEGLCLNPKGDSL